MGVWGLQSGRTALLDWKDWGLGVGGGWQVICKGVRVPWIVHPATSAKPLQWSPWQRHAGGADGCWPEPCQSMVLIKRVQDRGKVQVASRDCAGIQAPVLRSEMDQMRTFIRAEWLECAASGEQEWESQVPSPLPVPQTRPPACSGPRWGLWQPFTGLGNKLPLPPPSCAFKWCCIWSQLGQQSQNGFRETGSTFAVLIRGCTGPGQRQSRPWKSHLDQTVLFIWDKEQGGWVQQLSLQKGLFSNH